MYATLRHMREAEDHMKASLFSALSSVWIVVFVLLLVVVLGVVLAKW